jgi:hypothetical protein
MLSKRSFKLKKVICFVSILSICFSSVSPISAFAAEKKDVPFYQQTLDSLGPDVTIKSIEEIGEFTIDCSEKNSLLATDQSLPQFYGEVTFSQTNWGAYHEFAGNHIAYSVAFTDDKGNLIPDVGMRVSLRRYGNDLIDATVVAWGDNKTYSTTGNLIIKDLSYRFYYQLTTNYTGLAKVRVAAIAYNY